MARWVASMPTVGARDRAVSGSAAVAVTPPAFGASLGTPVTAVGTQTTTVALATNVSVPAGARAVVGVSWYNPGVTVTLAGGGLTWTQVATVNGTADTSRHLALFVPTAAGPTSGTTLTATFSGTAFGRGIFGAYFTGVSTVGVTSTGKGNQTGALSQAWDTGSATTTIANSAVVGIAWLDGGFGTNAPATNITEDLDFNDSSNCSWTLGHRIVAATGSYSVGGTITYSDVGGGSEEWLAIMVALGA